MLFQQAPTASKKDKEEPTDDAPPMKMSNGKEQRLKDEKNLKVRMDTSWMYCCLYTLAD